MKRYLLVILGCLSLAACQHAATTSQSGPMDGWNFVASVGGLDGITQAHLGSLLKAHGIDCLIFGSVVYGVSVPTAKHSEAIRVIKEDLRKREYNITLHTHGKNLKYSVPDGHWRNSEPKLKYADLLSRHDYSASTALGALLRTPEVMNDVLAFPCVVRIKSLEREYMDSEQKVQLGHEFDIELAVKLDEEIGGKSLGFQVWDHGNQIRALGSSEWWQGEPSEIARNRQQYDKRKSGETPNHVPEGIGTDAPNLRH